MLLELTPDSLPVAPAAGREDVELSPEVESDTTGAM